MNKIDVKKIKARLEAEQPLCRACFRSGETFSTPNRCRECNAPHCGGHARCDECGSMRGVVFRPSEELMVVEALETALDQIDKLTARQELESREANESQKRAAQRAAEAIGHEATCRAVLYPGDPFEGCNCIVADIERECMGDVVEWMLRKQSEAREIARGRDRPPTKAEREAHAKTGGSWRCVARIDGDSSFRGLHFDRCQDPPDSAFDGLPKRRGSVYSETWWALNADQEPTTWPVAEGEQKQQEEAAG